MASKSNVIENAARTFTVRNITKEFYQPLETDTLTPEFHLELGEKNDVVIIEDRKKDWCELANKDVANVGLENVLRLVKKGVVDPSKLMFKDEEFIDISSIDAMDPQSVRDSIASQAANQAKLDGIAKQLDCSTDALIESFLKGTFNELVESKLKRESEVKENA